MIRDKKPLIKKRRSHFTNLLNAGTTSPVLFPSCDSDYDTSCLNDLGYHINEQLDLSQMVSKITIAANWALASLNRRTKCAGGFQYDTYTMLFNQLVLSRILTYSCIRGHSEFPVHSNCCNEVFPWSWHLMSVWRDGMGPSPSRNKVLYYQVLA